MKATMVETIPAIDATYVPNSAKVILPLISSNDKNNSNSKLTTAVMLFL